MPTERQKRAARAAERPQYDPDPMQCCCRHWTKEEETGHQTTCPMRTAGKWQPATLFEEESP